MVNPADIKIQAEPSPQGDSCRFMLNLPLYEGVAASFLDAASAAGSPLAEALMAVPGITRVVIMPAVVTVHRACDAPGDWRPLAMQVGKAIREHAASGKPAVSDQWKPDPAVDERIRKGVEELLAREVNPAIASHGGYIRLIDVKNKMAYVQLGGGCQGCGMADVTLKQGVETMLRERIPELVAVIDQTDHAGGTNPHFKPGKG